jgi:mannose-6-phosphate isomerase-like protein (cupin superfamily)
MLTSSLLVLWLALSPQTTPPPTQTAPPPKPQTPPPAKPPSKPPSSSSSTVTGRPATVELSVTTMVGMTIPGATVKAEGPTSRMGTTGADGRIVFENLPAGTYRFRIERESFVTLEKEIVVFAGGRTSQQAGLSAGTATPAPAAPPPPPAPTPSMSTPVLKPGEPQILQITEDIIQKLLRDKEPVAERPLGCSGATSSRLIRVNDSLAVHNHADADEVLYIFGGEVTLKLGDKEQNLSPGGFSLVPRGMAHSVTKRGRVQVVLLSVVSGPPCQ